MNDRRPPTDVETLSRRYSKLRTKAANLVERVDSLGQRLEVLADENEMMHQRLREAHAYMSWLVEQLCDDHTKDCVRQGCPATPSDVGLPSTEQPLSADGDAS